MSVFGEPVGQRAAARARVAFLAQDKPLYDGFTVAEMLRFGRQGNDRQAALDLFDAFGSKEKTLHAPELAVAQELQDHVPRDPASSAMEG